MEDEKKPCCELKYEDLTITCHETDDGYRVELTGDKDRIREWKKSCCREGGSGFKCC